MKNTLVGVLLVLVAVLVGTLLFVQGRLPAGPQVSTGTVIQANTNVTIAPVSTGTTVRPLENIMSLPRAVVFGQEVYTSANHKDLLVVATTPTAVPLRTEYCARFASEETCTYDAGKLRDAQRSRVALLERFLGGERPPLPEPLTAAFATEAGGFASTLVMELEDTVPGAESSYVSVTMEGQDITPVLTLRAYAQKRDRFYTFAYPLNEEPCGPQGRGCAITTRVTEAFGTCRMEESLSSCVTGRLSSDARLRTLVTEAAQELFASLSL